MTTQFKNRIETATAIANEITQDDAGRYVAKVWHRESTNDVRVYVKCAHNGEQFGSVTVHRNGKIYTNTKRYTGDIRRLVEHVAPVSA